MKTDQTTQERRSIPHLHPGKWIDIADVRSTAADIDKQARDIIQQRPVAAVLAAVGIGYLVARLVSRA